MIIINNSYRTKLCIVYIAVGTVQASVYQLSALIRNYLLKLFYCQVHVFQQWVQWVWCNDILNQISTFLFISNFYQPLYSPSPVLTSGAIQLCGWQPSLSGNVLLAAAAFGHGPTSPEPFTGLVGAAQWFQQFAARDWSFGRTGTRSGGSESLFRSVEFWYTCLSDKCYMYSIEFNKSNGTDCHYKRNYRLVF